MKFSGEGELSSGSIEVYSSSNTLLGRGKLTIEARKEHSYRIHDIDITILTEGTMSRCDIKLKGLKGSFDVVHNSDYFGGNEMRVSALIAYKGDILSLTGMTVELKNA